MHFKKLFDLLEKEKGVKNSRQKALNFLESLSNNADSKKEQEQIEKSIVSMLNKQTANLDEIDSTLEQLEGKLQYLNQEIKIKQLELETSEKKLDLIKKPDAKLNKEMRDIEEDMQAVYQMYVEKIRNHDYLVNQIEIYNQLV